MPNDVAAVSGPASTCSQGEMASLEAKCCLLELHLQAARSCGPPFHLRRPDSDSLDLSFRETDQRGFDVRKTCFINVCRSAAELPATGAFAKYSARRACFFC